MNALRHGKLFSDCQMEEGHTHFPRWLSTFVLESEHKEVQVRSKLFSPRSMQLLTPTTKEVSALIKTSKRESKQSSQIRDEIGKHDLLGASQSTQKLLPFALRIACRATASLWLFLRACERQTVTRINELVWTLLFKSISAKKKVMNDRSHCTDSNRKKKNNNLGWIFKKKNHCSCFFSRSFLSAGSL